MIPYVTGQKAEFKKSFGPKLGELNLNTVLELSEEDIVTKLEPIYKLIEDTSKDEKVRQKI